MRPWRQELNGTVLADPRATFTRYVRATRRSFTIGAGAKLPVTLPHGAADRFGSLYGNVDILGKPTRTKGRKGIIPKYRLISMLRLHPRAKTIKLRTGAAQVRNRTFMLPVRNIGNTIDPVSRHLPAERARLASRVFKSVSVVPGKLVALGLTSTSRLQEGPLHRSPRRVSRAGSASTCARASRSASG